MEPPRTSDCTTAVVSGGLASTKCEAPSPVLVLTELRELVFQLERPTRKRTIVRVRSMPSFLTPLQGGLEPPRTSDCTIVVVYGGLGYTGCEAPSPVLVVTGLRELVSSWRGRLESALRCACASCLRFWPLLGLFGAAPYIRLHYLSHILWTLVHWVRDAKPGFGGN